MCLSSKTQSIRCSEVVDYVGSINLVFFCVFFYVEPFF